MTHDPQKIANTAQSFLLAAERSLEQRPGPGQVQILFVPAIACRAFAIELYLKAIITLEDGTATGHGLSTLFGRLSTNSQHALRTRLSITEPVLKQKLNDASDAFVEWRYIFERESANLDMAFLEGMANASRTTAETMLNEAGPLGGS